MKMIAINPQKAREILHQRKGKVWMHTGSPVRLNQQAVFCGFTLRDLAFFDDFNGQRPGEAWISEELLPQTKKFVDAGSNP